MSTPGTSRNLQTLGHEVDSHPSLETRQSLRWTVPGEHERPTPGSRDRRDRGLPAARTLAPISLNRPVKAIEHACRLFNWNQRGLRPERRCIRFARLKGIGIFVLVLLIGLGVATFFVTRAPSRNLDTEGRAWVAHFSTWRADIARPLNQAVGSDWRLPGREAARSVHQASSQLWTSLAQLGSPPGLLDVVLEDAQAACAEVEHALAVNARYGSPALATTRLHLHRAESLLETARVSLAAEARYERFVAPRRRTE